MCYRWEDLKVGDYYEQEFTVGRETGNMYARLSGDFNPIHLDQDAGRNSRFGANIVHGMLVMSYVSGILGNSFPGQGTIYVGQNARFRRPIYYDEKFVIRVEIAGMDDDRRRLNLSTNVSQQGMLAITGEASVLFDSVPGGDLARKE